MKLNTVDDLYRYLDEMPNFRVSGAEAAHFDLERFRTFCEAMGNPQDKFATIHVAGTNGKGSTCQILGGIFHVAGYKTGMYSSPHLMEYRERFQIGGDCISDTELLDFFEQHIGLVERYRLTYFELSTAIAFWWFNQKEVDLAIIEVGLGGRLDATNVITPLVSIITNISLDHTDILGTDIESIAKEKAGIIKPKVPVVLGNIGVEAANVIKKVASGIWSTVYQAEDLQPSWSKGICTITQGQDQFKFSTDLNNPIQTHNVAVAWKVISVLEDLLPVSEAQFREALQHVKGIFKLPGRFERLHTGRNWYFDGAHNLDAVKGLKRSLQEIGDVPDTVLVLSMMKDKINDSVMSEFQNFKKIYYYTAGSKRAANIGDIKKWVPEASVIPDEKDQQIQFFKELESELVIFAGSFYFYATVRKWLDTLHSDH